jgi:hypothetical protein
LPKYPEVNADLRSEEKFKKNANKKDNPEAVVQKILSPEKNSFWS